MTPADSARALWYLALLVQFIDLEFRCGRIPGEASSIVLYALDAREWMNESAIGRDALDLVTDALRRALDQIDDDHQDDR